MTGETKNPLPVWYKPILSKEERATPMLLCRKPEPLKSFSRKRVQQLATPKKNHMCDQTRPPAFIRWGNQEPLWKVTEAAKSGSNGDSTFDKLAQPKKDFASKKTHLAQYEFSCGRGSPIRTTKKLGKLKEPSQRVIELAKNKTPYNINIHDQFRFSCGRSSPVWKVTQAARHAVSSPRIDILSRPKQFHVQFIGDRPVRTIVSRGAATAMTTERLESLSRPKDHCNAHYFVDSRKPEESITKVKKAALAYEASDRLRELSNPIGFSKDFEMPNLEFWRVKRSAMNAKSSDRFDELAKHVTRQSMDSVQYDQNAFTVSEAAKKARCTERVASLAQHVRR